MGRSRGAGVLVIAYVLNLSVIHLPGALSYIASDNSKQFDTETFVGLGVSVVGLATLLIGASVFRFVRGHLPKPITRNLDAGSIVESESHFGVTARKLLLIGVLAFFVALPISSAVPSFTALVSALGSLVVIGYWALFVSAIKLREDKTVLLLLLSLILLPTATLISGGFLSFGTTWVITIMALYLQLSRRRLLLLAISPMVVWVGLSVAVVYFNGRDQLRDAIWYENVDYATRFDRLTDVLSEFELFDPQKSEHTIGLEARLNQNVLVGLLVIRYDIYGLELAHGETLPLWSFIPRFFWPDKPAVGGGGDVVSHYTGLYFPPGTSVGTGQVFEFFVNYGWVGLLVGFLLWGAILEYLDEGLAHGLRMSSYEYVLKYGLPGVAMLHVNGNLMEIVISFIAAIITARLVIVFMKRQPRPRAHNGIYSSTGEKG